VLNGRIYRAAFLPLLFALVIAGFSLAGRTSPLGSNLAPDAFEGGRAFATLQALAGRFPERRPGSSGDRGLAAYVTRTLRGLGGAAGGGFAVLTRTVRAQTIDGERTLRTVIARRPGTTGKAPIAIIAHRDAAGGGARAELSGTVALLELARVLAASETQRTIVLVSSSGGSGGDAGAADFAAHASELAGGPVDAALVLGDLAGAGEVVPRVASFAASPASAPGVLRSTAEAAIAQQTGVAVGGPPGTLTQLAHLVFPLAGGEQGPLGARGLPAVLIGVGGEQAPPPNQPVSAARLEALGRATLSTVYALDGGPALDGGLETGLPIQRKAIPAWALRLLVAALLLPALLALLDGLARLRRQAVPVGRWLAWTLACGLPFLLCAVFALLLGALGAFPAPAPPVSPAALPFDAHALEATLASLLVLVLAWMAWPALLHRLGLPVRPAAGAAALGMLIVLGAVAVVVWALDPLTALLLVPALHLWLLLVDAPLATSAYTQRMTASSTPLPSGAYAASGSGSTGRGGRGAGWRLRAPALVALGVAPLALLIAFYAHRFDLGLGGVVHTALLLLASGRVGFLGAALWSVACGCAVAALLVGSGARELAGGDRGEPRGWLGEPEPIAGRAPAGRRPLSYTGPGSYAGPGSLGGTESALRR